MNAVAVFSSDPDLALLQEYAAREREAALTIAPVALRVFRRRGPAGIERGAFRRLAERLGLSAGRAMHLVNLGIALEKMPDVGDLVRSGLVPSESGATLGEALSEPGVVKPGEPWLQWAQTMSTREFRTLFLQRRDAARGGTSVYSVVAYLTPAAKADLDRCRTLLSRRGKQMATYGQTIAILALEWRGRHDPLLRKPGKRRAPVADGARRGRYISREADRAVRARSADGCRGPFCDNDTWVQRSHRKAHSKNGSPEADNLDLLCESCHKQYEAGLFLMSGDAENPVFTTPDGHPLDRRVPYRAGSDPEAAAKLDELERGRKRGGPPGKRSRRAKPPSKPGRGPPRSKADPPPPDSG